MNYWEIRREVINRKSCMSGNIFYPDGKLDVEFLWEVATGYNMADDESNIEVEFDIAFDDMRERAKRWTDKDSDFPNNPSHYGWELDGFVFITEYEGAAGCYWWDEFNSYPVCRP